MVFECVTNFQGLMLYVVMLVYNYLFVQNMKYLS